MGDSLRTNIEKGLKECKKCILILTRNFLSNNGWAKIEYDSIFTRECVEEKNLILPIWHDVEKKDIYQYSPILADRLAVNWGLGQEIAIKKICQALKMQ